MRQSKAKKNQFLKEEISQHVKSDQKYVTFSHVYPTAALANL